MLKTKLLILSYILFFLILIGQSFITNSFASINQPLHEQVYAFIKRLVVKGIITETQLGNSLPIERHRIAQSLVELYQKHNAGKCKLTKIEQAQLNRFLWLFKGEIDQDIPFPDQKLYLLSLSGEHYKIDIDPVIKQEISTDKNGKTSITTADFSLGSTSA